MSTSSLGNSGLAQSLRHMIEETDRFLKSAAASGDEKYDEVKDKFAEQMHQMRSQLSDLEETAIHKARHAARVADHAVHTHPYSAIGIAAAAGLLIGFLAASRR